VDHYKSWSKLNQQLSDLLCDELKNHLSYFLTRYHKVHNSYGRAAIRLDDRELVCFSWVEMHHQDYDLNEIWKETGVWNYKNSALKNKWDANATYHDLNFLMAATSFLQIPITNALYSDNNIIRIFAIVDRRIGKRTLQKLRKSGDYQSLPSWVKQFYELRLGIRLEQFSKRQ